MMLVRSVRAAILLAVLSGALPASAELEAPPAPIPSAEAAGGQAPADQNVAVLPIYLSGIDFDKPTQEAFKGWPPSTLTERPYWLPWSPLTFQRASVFDRPIFLLLTVPWNHTAQRMLHGALADPGVHRFLNENYISVAVRGDRRPDIHVRYGAGTWPTISLLLSDGSPMISQANAKGVGLPITLGYADKPAVLFHLSEGRKYFDRWQNFLHGISEVYEKRVDVEESKPGPVGPAALDTYVRWLLGNFDAKNGGFGAAPKIYPGGFAELAYEREDAGAPSLVDPARATIKSWVDCPLHDAKEGGFHRLAAAPGWGGIEYEKMLEVNVDILRDLAFVLRAQDDTAEKSALLDTARFLTTTLARPGGGFYNGQEADPTSVDGGGYWRAADRRNARPPGVDRMVFAGTNALAGAALLRTGALLGDSSLEVAGRAALDLVLARGVESGRGTRHVIEPDPENGRFLMSQADAAFGLLDGYESTGDGRYLDGAKDLAAFVRNNLRSGKEPSYRDHLPAAAEFGLLDVPYRPAVENARMARVLVRLEAQGVLADGRKEAETVLGAYAGDLTISGPRSIEAALAIQELLEPPLTVTIEGPAGDPGTLALRRAALNLPQGWVVVKTAAGKTPGALLEWRGKTQRAGRPADIAEARKHLVAASAGRP